MINILRYVIIFMDIINHHYRSNEYWFNRETINNKNSTKRLILKNNDNLYKLQKINKLLISHIEQLIPCQNIFDNRSSESVFVPYFITASPHNPPKFANSEWRLFILSFLSSIKPYCTSGQTQF